MTVRAPFFNQLVMPIFWLIVLLMGVGVVVGWRRADGRAVARSLAGPAVASLVITAALWLAGVRQWIAVVGLSTCFFTLLTTLAEIWRGVRLRHGRGEGWGVATARLFALGRRRYGGYVVHVGVTLLAIGVVGSNVYQLEAEQTLAAGESLTIGAYTLTFTGLSEAQEPDKASVFANVTVSQEGRELGVLQPSKDVFRLREDQPMTIPSILHRPLEDVYTLLGAFTPDTGRATIKAYVNPLIGFVWLGLVVLILGTMVAAWPDGSEERVMNAELKRLTGGHRPGAGDRMRFRRLARATVVLAMVAGMSRAAGAGAQTLPAPRWRAYRAPPAGTGASAVRRRRRDRDRDRARCRRRATRGGGGHRPRSELPALSGLQPSGLSPDVVRPDARLDSPAIGGRHDARGDRGRLRDRLRTGGAERPAHGRRVPHGVGAAGTACSSSGRWRWHCCCGA